MEYIPVWSTLYNVKCLPNNDLIVLGQKNHFFLSADKFPLFHLIDGIKSESDILDCANSPQQISFFLHQLEQLKKTTNFIQNSNNAIDKTDYTNTLTILEKVKDELAPTDIILVSATSFFDNFIEHHLHSHNGNFIFYSILNGKLAFSPIFSSLNTEHASVFRQRLLHNKPIIGFLNNLFPNENNSPPITNATLKPFHNLSHPTLIRKIIHELKTKEEQVVILSEKGELEKHPCQLTPLIPAHNYKEQLNTPIHLDCCLSLFNKDGGSRSVSPETTVQRLKQFVSPITGVITHINELNPEDDNPVKIYATAFFKTPAVKDSHKITNESFVQSCLGKGVTHIQSQASGLCEAVERYSAQYQGNEPLLLAKRSELSQRYYDFQDLVPYSTGQYQKFSDPNHPDSKLKQAALPYNDETVHWLPTWSLNTNEQVYVPLTSCFANIPFEDDRFARWHSNGCAAGNTLEEAILQGMFELIERDATAIWWYNRIERPEFDINLINSDYLRLLRSTLEPDHDFWVLDLTHDIGVPVMVAVGRNRKTQGISFGFGCHLQRELAAQRALTELCQLIPIRDQNGAPFDFNAVEEGPYLFPSVSSSEQPARIQASGDIKVEILAIVDRLKNLGFETLALNYSRDPLPIKTAKVFVPGLCHIWPQLANERLYSTPVQLGWLKDAYNEDTINQQALYI